MRILFTVIFPGFLFLIIGINILGLYPQSTFFRHIGWLLSEKNLRIESGINYGKLPRQKLDVYKPENDDQAGPIVVFYYGGGWKSGEREIYHFVGAAFASHGITTVIPDYRLYPEVTFPSFIEDAALAYHWTWQNFVKEKSVKRPIIVMGHSAGAYIAAMIAFNKKYVQNEDDAIQLPSGLIGLSGPYAFDPTTWETTKDIFRTATTADSTRPVTFVSSDSPPALLFHGDRDDIVKLWNMQTLGALLEKNQRSSIQQELTGINHIQTILSVARPFRSWTPVFSKSLDFIYNLKR